jgi:hypothetical protein
MDLEAFLDGGFHLFSITNSIYDSVIIIGQAVTMRNLIGLALFVIG